MSAGPARCGRGGYNAAPHYCPACNGTGRDEEKTRANRARGTDGYVMCWDCNGNGLDPAAYFNWKKTPEQEREK